MSGKSAHQIVNERLTAVAITRRSAVGGHSNVNHSVIKDPGNVDGGSATPISEDGYFLTADHVLARSPGHNVFIVYSNGGSPKSSKARIVWRSASDDLALLHIPVSTPYYYDWSNPNGLISIGHSVTQGGVTSGTQARYGKTLNAIEPGGAFVRSRVFHIDMKLQPGDSGGPIVGGDGRLIGINSAVEYLTPLETEIFIESEGVRPNTAKIESIIQNDRRSL